MKIYKAFKISNIILTLNILTKMYAASYQLVTYLSATALKKLIKKLVFRKILFFIFINNVLKHTRSVTRRPLLFLQTFCKHLQSWTLHKCLKILLNIKHFFLSTFSSQLEETGRQWSSRKLMWQLLGQV